MSELKIITDNKYRPVLYWYDLLPKEQEEYAYLNDSESGEEVNDCSFFRYRKWCYCLQDFMRVDYNAPFKENIPFKGWDGYHNDSFFSGVLVKYSECGDAVKVATYIS